MPFPSLPTTFRWGGGPQVFMAVTSTSGEKFSAVVCGYASSRVEATESTGGELVSEWSLPGAGGRGKACSPSAVVRWVCRFGAGMAVVNSLELMGVASLPVGRSSSAASPHDRPSHSGGSGENQSHHSNNLSNAPAHPGRLPFHPRYTSFVPSLLFLALPAPTQPTSYPGVIMTRLSPREPAASCGRSVNPGRQTEPDF